MATKGYNLEQTGEQVQAALNKTINLGPATEEADGLMTATDKASLEHLNSVIDTKVDKVTGKGLSTNDFTNEDKSKLDTAYQVPSTGIPAADMSSGVQTSLGKANSAVQPADLVPITEKIPAQASAQNQLADKAFVNSSISTASADFKGTYDSLAELQAVTADKNDYGYVVSTDEAGNTVYSRYKYNGSSWVFEYDLNNSSFTAAEWAAIQSGITAPLVQKLGALPTNADLQSALSGKQATLVSGTNIKTVDGQSILGRGNLSVSDPNAVKVTAQTWTDAQKTQARTNIGAYAKPSGGIPKADLASGVQGSLDLADSAIQARPSGEVDPTITPAEYATQEELAQLEAKVDGLDVSADQDDFSVEATKGYYGTNGAFVSSANYRYYQITNNGYKNFSATLYAHLTGVAVLAFYNSENTFDATTLISAVASTTTDTSAGNYSGTIPEGTKVIMISNRINYGDAAFTLSAHTDGLTDRVSELETAMQDVHEEVDGLSQEVEGLSQELDRMVEPENFVPEDDRLNADTDLVNGDWTSHRGGVLSIEDDYVKVTAPGIQSREGIKDTHLQDYIANRNVRMSFKIKALNVSSLALEAYYAGDAHAITITNEWTEMEFYLDNSNWTEFRIVTPATGYGACAWGMKDFSVISLDDESISSRLNRLETITALKGKKIGIIGDSISTGVGLTPYWVVKDIDVGNEITVYVSYLDVYNAAGTTPTNKTIGGVLLTTAMIGTPQTFTPVAEDVGKVIGQPLSFYAARSWPQIMCDRCGAKLLANASFSGASLCSPNPDSVVTPYLEDTYGWHPYTIGRLRTRDDAGNFITPDIVIIFRGVNDFSKYNATIKDWVWGNGYPTTDIDEGRSDFRRAYYLTIEKVREAYPKAKVYVCTFTVFNRTSSPNWPPMVSGNFNLLEVNAAVRDIANQMGCGVINIDKSGFSWENYVSLTLDGTHPNDEGKEYIIEQALRDL